MRLFVGMLAAVAVIAVSLENPADGSDLHTFDDAKAEVIRLRAMLAGAGRAAPPSMSMSMPMETGAWEAMETAHSPPYRAAGGFCSLPDGKGLLLFGGSDGEHSGNFMNDTWLYANGDWQEVKSPVVPGSRSNARLVPYKTGAVMFGGFVPDQSTYGMTTIDDTWLFDVPTLSWSQLHLATRPPARDSLPVPDTPSPPLTRWAAGPA